jgi:hypothetical protein
MRVRACPLVAVAVATVSTWLLAGCNPNDTARSPTTAAPAGGDQGDNSAAADMAMGGATDEGTATPADLTLPRAPDDCTDAGRPPGTLGDGGVFAAPPVDMGTIAHAPPGTLAGIVVLGGGTDFRDVSTDVGGGTWAATSAHIYYWPHGTTAPTTYDQSSGLAQGQTTWNDDYWCLGDGVPCPATWSVSFTSVSGGEPGQAVVGNIGYIADRIDVDPATGALRDVIGLQVTRTQHDDSTPAAAAELAAQRQRVVASWKVAVDVNGTFDGTAYLGGWHGLSAFHGMTLPRGSGVCGLGCSDFEEHVHAFLSTDAAGRDIRAITFTPTGDLWIGDADVVWFLAQRSQGPFDDFFSPAPQIPGQTADHLDVFPGRPDMVFGIAVDGGGGVWVASYGNGLAYLAPSSYAPTYWTAADQLPDNYLTGVAVDGSGDVWVATQSAGVARYVPALQSWTYYTAASGLPSNSVRALYIDPHVSGRAVYFATANGIARYAGP